VDGRTVPTPADRLLVSAGTTVVGLTDLHRSRWWLLDRDRLVPLLDEPAAYVVPVLSADGGTVAWRAEVSSRPLGDQVAEVEQSYAVYDVPTRTVLGRTTVTGRVHCCDQGGATFVLAVANDGRVALGDGGDRLSMWRAGDDPVPASWRDFGGPGIRDGVVSPDESRVATTQKPGEVLVRDLRTGEKQVLDVPGPGGWRVAAWADAVHVLLARGEEGVRPDVVSCDATTGDCGDTP
jgi:hypothetical protein